MNHFRKFSHRTNRLAAAASCVEEKATHQLSLRFCTPSLPEYNVDGTYKSFGDSVVGRERNGRINTSCI